MRQSLAALGFDSSWSASRVAAVLYWVVSPRVRLCVGATLFAGQRAASCPLAHAGMTCEALCRPLVLRGVRHPASLQQGHLLHVHQCNA